jgi:hypothetical protein
MSSQSDYQRQLDQQIVGGIQQAGRSLALAIEAARHTCIRCVHFTEATEICALAQRRPPAKVIALGCPKFDDCPF